MKKARIILDYDDVLVDCNGAAIDKLNSEKGTNFSIYDIKTWGVLNSALDERLKYYSDSDFMSGLKPFHGACEFVRELTQIAEVFIMTSVEPACAGIRVDHILTHFPEIKPSNIIIGGRKDLVQADIMLDDGYHNLVNSSSVEYPVLFQKPWNYDKTGMLSVNGYKEFMQLVHTILNSSKEKDLSRTELVCLVGATGTGKKDIVKELVVTGRFQKVLTYTTKQSDDYHSLPFDEFCFRKESGFFSETSSYHGEQFGLRKEDIQEAINRGKIPMVIVDINGAMSLQSEFRTLNVFVESSKEDCIKSILERDMDTDKKVQSIVSLDLELHNRELCDITVTKNEAWKIMKMFS